MAPKRARSPEALDDNDDDSAPPRPRENSDEEAPVASTGSPTKRLRRMAFFPQTPSTGPRIKSTFTTPARTPYPLRAYDSPSNPFGRKHTESLIRSLPPPTSYSKHLALRFQFVRKGIPNRKGGVFRIVQVPLSYTFVHLRCLLSFLFGGDLLDVAQGRAEDHLFEIKKELVSYSMTYKPGQIKRGQTWAKLSSTRDPCRWREEEDGEDVDDEEVDEAEEEGRVLEEEHDDWEWKDEEDFTVAHAWPEGLNEERGIIYYHSRTTQIHMTVNVGILPRRRGSGNTPHIFSAQGHVYLSSAPLPRVLFKPLHMGKSPANRISTRSKRRVSPEEELSDADPDDEGENENDVPREFDENHPFNVDIKLCDIDDELDSSQDSEEEGESGPEEEENFKAVLNPRRWNLPLDAFSIYLRKYMGPSSVVKKPFTLFDDDEEEEGHSDYYGDEALDDTLICTPDLIQSTSSSSSPPPGSSSPGPILLSSSPQKSYVDSRIHLQLPSPSVYSPSQFHDSQFFLKAKYKQTPAPPRAKVHRMRIERVERRIEKSKRGKILKLKVDDEKEAVEEESDAGEVEKGEGEGEEVDQLADDDDDDDSVFVPPQLKEGEIWDPFGDEEEV